MRARASCAARSRFCQWRALERGPGRPLPRPNAQAAPRAAPLLPKSEPQLQRPFPKPGVPPGPPPRAFGQPRPSPQAATRTIRAVGLCVHLPAPGCTQLCQLPSLTFHPGIQWFPKASGEGGGGATETVRGPPSLQRASAGPLQKKLAKPDLVFRCIAAMPAYCLHFQELLLSPL